MDAREKWASLDTFIGRDLNLIRLRVCALVSFAQLALSTSRTGDLLTVGVSFRTAPLIVSVALRGEVKGRKTYLIDPFSGNKTCSEVGFLDFNKDFELVKKSLGFTC